MALTRSTDPLVWIDCEMTGLDPSTDHILSISCIITDSALTPLEPDGFHAVIATSSAVLAGMSEWCIETHGRTGLTAACLSSTTSAASASDALQAYIASLIPDKKTALLAGNSVHVDKFFLLREPWTGVLEGLHYRIFDVSAIKEAVRRWTPQCVLERAPVKMLGHTAREDVLESIDEARFYMGLLSGLV